MGLFNSFKKEKAKKSAAKNENHTDIAAASEAMLEEVSIDITSVEATKLPIEQLGLFGAGIASVLPPLRTISQNITFNNGNLFRWVNSANAAGTLKLNTKDNLLGGAFIDKQGISRYAKFQAAGAQSATAVTVMPIDPAKLMMAAALMAIEHKLDDIAETQKKILTFLEHNKEAEIESDLKILTDIARELKFNWDNTEYTTNHYKLALDIKCSAEKNIIFCRKQIEQAVKESKAIHTQNTVDAKQENLHKLFRYYRMALYIYSFSSYIETMLLGNFESDYIHQIKEQIEKHCNEYKSVHSDCYKILEKSSSGSIEKHILNGVGAAAGAVGSLIGSIPLIKEGQADEWLTDKGAEIRTKSQNIGESTLAKFKECEETSCIIFIDNLELVDKLYNQTSDIYIDRENVYLAFAEAKQ